MLGIGNVCSTHHRMQSSGIQDNGNFKIISEQNRRYTHFGMEYIAIDREGVNINPEE